MGSRPRSRGPGSPTRVPGAWQDGANMNVSRPGRQRIAKARSMTIWSCPTRNRWHGQSLPDRAELSRDRKGALRRCGPTGPGLGVYRHPAVTPVGLTGFGDAKKLRRNAPRIHYRRSVAVGFDAGGFACVGWQNRSASRDPNYGSSSATRPTKNWLKRRHLRSKMAKSGNSLACPIGHESPTCVRHRPPSIPRPGTRKAGPRMDR